MHKMIDPYLTDQFNMAVNAVKKSKSNSSVEEPTNKEKLIFYKYYKQATEGDCNVSQPWYLQYEARAKWDAWNSVKGMSKNTAMRKYCNHYLDMKEKYNDK